MLYNLSNDILYNICYNNNINTEKDSKFEMLKLRNIMMTNKSLFNFIIIRYEKLYLSNLDTNYKYMFEKYHTFYEINIFEDLGIINLDKFKNCKYVSLRSCYNITHVNCLKNIQFLDLSNCFELKDVSMLGHCKKLELSNCNKIENVSNLGNIPYLDLSHCNKIVDISNLGNHTYLNLKNTNICNISNLSNVETLDISYNYNIRDISSLKNVYNLDVSFCLEIELSTVMNNIIFTAQDSHLVDDDILYLKNVNTLNLRDNNNITNLSPLIKTRKLDIRQCNNIRILPNKNILDYINVSRHSFYFNLLSLNINTLNIKKINIDNYF